MEVAQSFLGLPPPQKWPAAVGGSGAAAAMGALWPPTNPREIQLEKQHKGAGGLTACGAPWEGSTNGAPKGGGQLGRGGHPSQRFKNKTLIKGL